MENKKLNKLVIFTLTVGLVLGLLLTINSLLIIKILGYVSLWIAIALVLFAMWIIPKWYNILFKEKLNFITAILIGITIFTFSSIINLIVSEYDFKGNVISEYYSHGYTYHVAEETLKQSIPITIFFAVVFLPIYNHYQKKINRKS